VVGSSDNDNAAMGTINFGEYLGNVRNYAQ
jgi:hypothetical protein